MAALILIIIIIALLIIMIKIVPQSNAYVIERLGKYIGTWEVGIHFLIPVFDRIAKKVTFERTGSRFSTSACYY